MSGPAQLAAYLKQPIGATTVQKHLKDIVANPPQPELPALSPTLKAYMEPNGGQCRRTPLPSCRTFQRPNKRESKELFHGFLEVFNCRWAVGFQSGSSLGGL
jgi:hypothetical protein